MSVIRTIPYRYQNIPIPGGGYVSGFTFHDSDPDCMYIRTDIGGTYRYNRSTERFESLIDHVTMSDLSETFPIAVAVDSHRPERLLIACGIERNRFGTLCISDDRGKSFTYKNIPTMVFGNWPGHGTGPRLLIDKNNSDTLYFATQRGGLLKSTDLGDSWTKLDVCGEEWLTFVWLSPDSKTVIVGAAGVTTRLSSDRRGHTLFVSYNSGESFEKLELPEYLDCPSRMQGYVPNRYSYDGKYFYVTFAVTGPTARYVENGYACEAADLSGGRVIRYEFNGGRITSFTDITPEPELFLADPMKKGAVSLGAPYDFGFGGISTSASVPGLVICTTITRPDGDFIFRSYDYGKTWEIILFNYIIGKLKINTSYLNIKPFQGLSVVHWMCDFQINPTNPNEAWFTTGYGTFRTQNLLSKEVEFEDHFDGIEVTVHINAYCPIQGDTLLLDAVGDLGGFAFTSLDRQPENSFLGNTGERYPTCTNMDSPDCDNSIIYTTARTSWSGYTLGGLLKSSDYGHTFERVHMPYGISDKLDKLLGKIEKPNNNAGWIAVSADASALCWCVADNAQLPIDCIVCSRNDGKSWEQTCVYDLEDNLLTKGYMKVFADRLDPNIMYGFGDRSQIYVSKDFGKTFRELKRPADFPKLDMALIDVFDKTEIRGEAGKHGVFYMAMNTFGLWKMQYNKYTNVLELKLLTTPGDFCYRLGLGLISPDSDYVNDNKALYMAGTIDGVYAFYRSFDEGSSWERLNSDAQMYGDINSLEADKRVFGRFFIATGSRGILWGEKD